MAPKPLYYTLTPDHEPVPCFSVEEYYLWRKAQPEPDGLSVRVALDLVGHYRVSTVFLGIDHGMPWDEDAPPILWETMIFDEGPHSDDFSEPQWRYTSHWDALSTHQEIVNQLILGVPTSQLLTNSYELN